jgi:hypothetical protein
MPQRSRNRKLNVNRLAKCLIEEATHDEPLPTLRAV